MEGIPVMVAYSFNKRFIEPILVGLGERRLHDVAPKRQTIRARGNRRHVRPGETIQLYTGMRTKQCRKIGESRCVSIAPVIIWPSTMAIMVDGVLLSARAINKFAMADGFSGVLDMQGFWLKEHKGDKFQGLLIRWEPLNGD